jgi:hypothetical protein
MDERRKQKNVRNEERRKNYRRLKNNFKKQPQTKPINNISHVKRSWAQEKGGMV